MLPPRFNIERHRGTDEETIEFLNKPAKNFFSGYIQFEKSSYKSYFRSTLLDAIIVIERVIKGTFNCDIFMKNVDFDLLKQMFPNGLSLFQIEKQEDIIILGRFFETLRNASAHAKSSMEDNRIFDMPFHHLCDQKVYNSNIRYEKHGHLTVAGLMFIVLNFLREETIAKIVKLDNIFGFITTGKRSFDNGSNFVKEISKTNLTVPIRTIEGDTVISSVFGKYFTNDDNADVSVGAPEFPTYRVSAQYSGNVLTIKRNSLTRSYYENDYCLTINDEKHFIKLANKLPEMAFVDVLYTLGISVFDNETYNNIKDRFDTLYIKLNYPKFYTDKNLSVLFLPETNSDFRLVSAMSASSIIFVLNNFELYLMNVLGFKYNDDYSKLSKMIKDMGMPIDVRREVVALRNLVMHGYLFGEYIVLNDEHYHFTLEFSVKTLEKLLSFAKTYDEGLYGALAGPIANRFIGKIISGKYKKAIDTTKQYVENGPSKELLDDLYAKNEFIRHSFFDTTLFNKLNSLCYDVDYIIEVKVKGMDNCFYFYSNSEENVNLYKKFIKKFDFNIVNEQHSGVMKMVVVSH